MAKNISRAIEMPSVPCVLCGKHETRRLFHKQGRDFLRCRGCGLVRVDPLPDPQSLARYYDHSYREGAYSTFAGVHEVRSLIARHRLAAVEAELSAGSWLDLGCSTGDFLAVLDAAGYEAEGLDLSAEAVARARARGLNAHCQTVEEFRPSQRFQTISAFDLLEHLLDARAFLRHLHSWLEPGGHLVLTLPDARSLYPRLLMRRHWFYYWPDEHLFYFDRHTISRLLREEGFELRRIARATKPLTLDYATRMLELFNARLGRVARAAVSPLPGGLLERAWPLYLGEMLVVAQLPRSPTVALPPSS